MKKSRAMIEQIKLMNEAGHSIRKIASALNVSRNTIRRYLRDEQKTESLNDKPETKVHWKMRIDWDWVILERSKGVTVKQLYSEVAPAISYDHFCRAIRDEKKPTIKTALRLIHNPGEKAYVDYCDGLKITCPRTGKQTKTQLFCGVLPFSSYTFAIFSESQKLTSFIRSHEAMWAYFGGVSKYVVPDNLRSAVKKAHRYDPETNPTYCDYGNHAGFAVLPARPYTPRDKASVETGVGVLQRTFYQQVRNETFYSLDELNRRLNIFLKDFNNRIMKDHGVSREDRFSKEKDKLLALPKSHYDIYEWKTPKVHPDCCIQVDKSFYSVPFQYCGQSVRVKVTDTLLEIYSEDLEHIVCHIKSKKIGTVKIDEQHLPPWHLQNSKFELQNCLKAGAVIGEKTSLLLDQWFSGSHPLKFLRRAQGLTRLYKDGISREALEYAASQAITYKKHNLSYIKSCALSYATRKEKSPNCLPIRDATTIHLHKGNPHV